MRLRVKLQRVRISSRLLLILSRMLFVGSFFSRSYVVLSLRWSRQSRCSSSVCMITISPPLSLLGMVTLSSFFSAVMDLLSACEMFGLMVCGSKRWGSRCGSVCSPCCDRSMSLFCRGRSEILFRKGQMRLRLCGASGEVGNVVVEVLSWLCA